MITTDFIATKEELLNENLISEKLKLFMDKDQEPSTYNIGRINITPFNEHFKIELNIKL